MSGNKHIVVLHCGLDIGEVHELSTKISGNTPNIILAADYRLLDNIVKGAVTLNGGKGFTEHPSENSKTISVTSEIDSIILQEQLRSLGIEATVVVNPGACNDIVKGLIASPVNGERIGKAIGSTGYTGDIANDATLLVDSLVAHFQYFCVHHKGYKAVCDSVTRDLSYELRVRSGLSFPSLPVNEEAAEKGEFIYPKVPQDDIIPKFLAEILSELKGIKDAVKGPSVTVPTKPVRLFNYFAVANLLGVAEKLNIPDFADDLKELVKNGHLLGNQSDLHNHPAVKKFLSAPMLSVPQMVEGLNWFQTLFEPIKNPGKTDSGEQSNNFDIRPWLDQVFQMDSPEVKSPVQPAQESASLSNERVMKISYDFSEIDPSETSEDLPTTIMNKLADEFWRGDATQVTLKGLGSLSGRDRGVLAARLKGASTTVTRKPTEVKAPGTKEDYIGYLNKALSDPDLERPYPALSVGRLSVEDRREIAKLLNPSFSVVHAGKYDPLPATWDASIIFSTLLEALDGTVNQVGFYGLNTLTAEQKQTMRKALKHCMGNQSSSDAFMKNGDWYRTQALVKGDTPREFLEGLFNALVGPTVSESSIVITDVHDLHPEDICELRGLLNIGLQKEGRFIGGTHTATRILEGLIKALSSTGPKGFLLQDIDSMNQGARVLLHSVLLGALKDHEKMEAARREFVLNGVPLNEDQNSVQSKPSLSPEPTNSDKPASGRSPLAYLEMAQGEEALGSSAPVGSIRVGFGAPIGNHKFDLRPDGGIIITTEGLNGGLRLTLLQQDGTAIPLDIRGPGHGPVGK